MGRDEFARVFALVHISLFISFFSFFFCFEEFFSAKKTTFSSSKRKKEMEEVTEMEEEEEEEEPRRVRSPPPPNSSVNGDVLLDQQLQRDEVRFPSFRAFVCAGDDTKHIARCIFLYTHRSSLLRERENTTKCVFFMVFAAKRALFFSLSMRARALSRLLFCSFLSLSLSLEMLRVFSLSLRGSRDESSLSLAGCY